MEKEAEFCFLSFSIIVGTRAVAQLVAFHVCDVEGRRFESCQSDSTVTEQVDGDDSVHSTDTPIRLFILICVSHTNTCIRSPPAWCLGGNKAVAASGGTFDVHRPPVNYNSDVPSTSQQLPSLRYTQCGGGINFLCILDRE
ncbi:MAG: hypothetical protein JWN75_186 [Candidatus Saccharibacteria bacterium]|nr:hypothetical protein [Candidatus Saccharibacteria bacterium]